MKFSSDCTGIATVGLFILSDPFDTDLCHVDIYRIFKGYPRLTISLSDCLTISQASLESLPDAYKRGC